MVNLISVCVPSKVARWQDATEVAKSEVVVSCYDNQTLKQGRPGTARNGGPGDLWHGTARKIMARKILARHGTENIGTENYWHGTARKNIIKLFFWRKYCWVEKSETFS